jgi:hypothetical protein
MVSLTSARELALETLQKAQTRYKGNYDRRAREFPSDDLLCPRSITQNRRSLPPLRLGLL